MIDQRPLPHRVLTLDLAVPATTVTAHAQIASAVLWRDACDARQLAVNILVRHLAGLAELEDIVEHVDTTAARHRDRSTIRVYCSFAESIEHVIGQLADIDTRAPRIEFIRVLDCPLERGRLAQLAREAASAESSRLLFWTYLELSSTRELVQLAALMDDQARGPLDQASFRRFPIVEIPGPFNTDDAEPIAQFWSRQPQLQEAATRSLNGRVSTFFQLFEIARLARVGVELPPISSDAGPEDYRCLSAFRKWLASSNLLTAEPRIENVVLEHDVDLLADSHECQSPVFTFAGVSAYVEAARSAERKP